MITWPSNTKQIIDEIRGTIGREVQFVTSTLTGCPICDLNPWTNVSTDSFCPVCSGTYWIPTYSGTLVSGHITWGQADILNWQSPGLQFDGDVRVQIELTTLNQQLVDNSDWIEVDNKRVEIKKSIFRGVPTLNRILLDCIEVEGSLIPTPAPPTPYYQKVLGIESASLIAYWPLWEASGSVSRDISGNLRHGAYVNVGYGEDGIGDGYNSIDFNGEVNWAVASRMNPYSTSLASAFNGLEGTLSLWARVASNGVWLDNTQRRMAFFGTSSSNYILYIDKHSTGLNANKLHWAYTVGGFTREVYLATTPTNMFHVAMSWSKSGNVFRAFYNGVQQGTDLSVPNSWTGTMINGSTAIGNFTSLVSMSWLGNIAHVALWNRALTPAQIAQLATI